MSEDRREEWLQNLGPELTEIKHLIESFQANQVSSFVGEIERVNEILYQLKNNNVRSDFRNRVGGLTGKHDRTLTQIRILKDEIFKMSEGFNETTHKLETVLQDLQESLYQ